MKQTFVVSRLSQLSSDAENDSNLIGQFGFYSVAMFADHVGVLPRKAGEEQAWRWVSDGKSASTSNPRSGRSQSRLSSFTSTRKEGDTPTVAVSQEVVKKYSNHISFAIFFTYEKSEWNEAEKKSEKTTEQVNASSALWRSPRSELTEEGYTETLQIHPLRVEEHRGQPAQAIS